jgi:hypothetical protein
LGLYQKARNTACSGSKAIWQDFDAGKPGA